MYVYKSMTEFDKRDVNKLVVGNETGRISSNGIKLDELGFN